jgi:hypothetical protein
MPTHDKPDSVMATGSIPRLGQRRFLVLVGATVASCSLLLGDWLITSWRRSDDLGDRFPPGVLADYLPEDSAAVLAVNVRQLRETPIGEQPLSPFLQRILVHAELRLPWLESTRIKPLDDFDTLLVSFASNVGGEPLLLARGRFDSSRFQIGPDKLQDKPLDRFRIWQDSDHDANQKTLLATVGDFLVVSKAKNRVQAALKQASGPRPVRMRDGTLRQLLEKVDRRQGLWLAASMKNLSPISGIDNYWLKMILRPLLAHAESVYGGITCAEDLRAELHFSTATDADAAQLEADLKNICEVAPGLTLLAHTDELLPLLRLLAAGQIRREGKTIQLRCQIAAEQLEK